MADEKSKKHPEKAADSCRPACDIGGEKPCMMDELFDENFDLRVPSANKGATNPDSGAE